MKNVISCNKVNLMSVYRGGSYSCSESLPFWMLAGRLWAASCPSHQRASCCDTFDTWLSFSCVRPTQHSGLVGGFAISIYKDTFSAPRRSVKTGSVLHWVEVIFPPSLRTSTMNQVEPTMGRISPFALKKRRASM